MVNVILGLTEETLLHLAVIGWLYNR